MFHQMLIYFLHTFWWIRALLNVAPFWTFRTVFCSSIKQNSCVKILLIDTHSLFMTLITVWNDMMGWTALIYLTLLVFFTILNFVAISMLPWIINIWKIFHTWLTVLHVPLLTAEVSLRAQSADDWHQVVPLSQLLNYPARMSNETCRCNPGHPQALQRGGLPPKVETPWYTGKRCSSSLPAYGVFVVTSRLLATGVTEGLTKEGRSSAVIINILTHTRPIAWAVERCSAMQEVPYCSGTRMFVNSITLAH